MSTTVRSNGVAGDIDQRNGRGRHWCGAWVRELFTLMPMPTTRRSGDRGETSTRIPQIFRDLDVHVVGPFQADFQTGPQLLQRVAHSQSSGQ